MSIGYTSLNLNRAPHMEQQVEEGERDRRWFLHARESPERPFAVILEDLLLLSHGNIGDEMHTVVAAVVVTRPAC